MSVLSVSRPAFFVARLSGAQASAVGDAATSVGDAVTWAVVAGVGDGPAVHAASKSVVVVMPSVRRSVILVPPLRSEDSQRAPIARVGPPARSVARRCPPRPARTGGAIVSAAWGAGGS